MTDARLTASPPPARPRGVAAGTLAGRSRRSPDDRGRRARRAGHHRDRRAPVRRGARRVEARARDRARPRRGALLHGRGLRGAAPARPGPALPRDGPGERLLETIVAARSTERVLSLDARLGFFYDDNVRVVPSANGREPLVADLRRLRHTSTGELFAVRADYVWWRTEDWESSLGYSFFTTYNNDVPRFSVLDHLVSAGLVRKLSLGSRPAQLGLQYSYEWLGLDADEFLTRHTLVLSGAVVESEHHLTQGFPRFKTKDFGGGAPPPPRQEVRDAHNYPAGFLPLLRFAQDRHFVKVGYQIDWDQTDGRNYEYVGHRLSAGAQYTLPVGGVRLKYDFDVHLRDYRHRSSILPTYAPDTRRRADQEYTHVARAELPLPGNFTLAAEVLVTNARSNIEVFDFDRHVFSLVLSWAY